MEKEMSEKEREMRAFELEKLYEFIKLHTGKEDVTMQVVSMGEKIRDAFKWRGQTFGRLLMTPEPGVDGLIRVAISTRKNYLPCFHMVFKDSWHTYQQMRKYEGPEVYQVVTAKSDYWTTMLLFCKEASTWEELVDGVKKHYASKRMTELNKAEWLDYQNRTDGKPTKRSQKLYELGELLDDIERFKGFK